MENEFQKAFSQIRKRNEENRKTIKKGAIAMAASFTMVLGFKGYEIYKQCQPITADVIGDPNAQDPNDTYIEVRGQRFYGTIDGQSIEDYINRERN